MAAEKLEGEFSKTEVVAQIWVYGNSLESTLVAVVVPESHILTDWAKQAGVEGDLAAICKSDKVSVHASLIISELSTDWSRDDLIDIFSHVLVRVKGGKGSFCEGM